MNWLALALKSPENIPAPDTRIIEAIVRQAKKQGVSYLVHHFLAVFEPPITKDDNAILEQLAPQKAHLIASEILREHELKELFKLFKEKNINFLLLKGELLAYRYYPEPYLRERCDTDILFRDKSEAERAWSILEPRGYTRRNTLSGEFVGFQFSCHRPLAGEINIVLDIHNRLSDYLYFANRFSFDELAREAVPVPTLSESTVGLGDIHALTHACMHRGANFPLNIQDRLIWLYDIHLLCCGLDASNWQKFADLVINKGIASVCVDALSVTHATLGTTLNDKQFKRMQMAGENETFKPHALKKRWKIYLADFWHNRGLANKLKQIENHLFPSWSYMEQKYQPKHKWLLAFYYPARWFSGLGKYF